LPAFDKAARAGIEKSNELGDADTAHIFTEVSRAIDKKLWFVEAQVQADALRRGRGASAAQVAPSKIRAR
jgi:starvation-inducible DNA-binding protein